MLWYLEYLSDISLQNIKYSYRPILYISTKIQKKLNFRKSKYIDIQRKNMLNYLNNKPKTTLSSLLIEMNIHLYKAYARIIHGCRSLTYIQVLEINHHDHYNINWFYNRFYPLMMLNQPKSLTLDDYNKHLTLFDNYMNELIQKQNKQDLAKHHDKNHSAMLLIQEGCKVFAKCKALINKMINNYQFILDSQISYLQLIQKITSKNAIFFIIKKIRYK